MEIWKEFGNSEKKNLKLQEKFRNQEKNENLEKLWKFWKFDEKLLKFRKGFEIWKKMEV